MKVYILVDFRPQDDGGLQIKAVYKSRKTAENKQKRFQNKDSYENQYLEVWTYEVKK